MLLLWNHYGRFRVGKRFQRFNSGWGKNWQSNTCLLSRNTWTEHKAKIINSFNHLNLPVLFGISFKKKNLSYGVANIPWSSRKRIDFKRLFSASLCATENFELVDCSTWYSSVMHWDLYKNHDKILHKWHKIWQHCVGQTGKWRNPLLPYLVDFGKAKNMSAVQKKQLTENEKKIYKKRLSTLHLKL